MVPCKCILSTGKRFISQGQGLWLSWQSGHFGYQRSAALIHSSANFIQDNYLLLTFEKSAWPKVLPIFVRTDRRTDQNEQLQLNEIVLDNPRVFYTPKKMPIRQLDLVHTIGLTQVSAQVYVHCAGQRLLDWWHRHGVDGFYA